MIRILHNPIFRKSATTALIALLCWAGISLPAWARSEYDVKAAYLYNFTKFVSWPESDAAETKPLQLCVIGEDPFQAALQPVTQRKAQGRPLTLRYPADAEDILGCDVLFISQSEARSVQNLLARAHSNHTLTVSDIRDFTRMGGMIGFVNVGNVIRFQINLAVAKSSGLHISSKLLELAQDVTQ